MYDCAASGRTAMEFHLRFHKVDFHPVPPAVVKAVEADHKYA